MSRAEAPTATLWLGRPARLPPGERWLSPDERERAARFRRETDRQTWIASRVLLRRALTAFAGDRSPGSWRFRRGARGRPEVEEPGGPRFSVSHTSGWVAVIVAARADVGVDVEAWRPVDVRELAPGVLTPGELGAIEAMAEVERPGAFFDRWVVKEAWAKAVGGGLANPLDRLRVTPAGPAVEPLDEPSAPWSFGLWRPDAATSAAWAIRESDATVRLADVSTLPE